MKSLKNIFVLFQSLGVFGFILLLDVIVIAWSVVNIVMLNRTTYELYWNSYIRDNYLELESYLLEQALYERYYVFTWDTEYLTYHEEISEEFDLLLEEFREEVIFEIDIEEDQFEEQDGSEELIGGYHCGEEPVYELVLNDDIVVLDSLKCRQQEYQDVFNEVVAAQGNDEEMGRLHGDVSTLMINEMRDVLQAVTKKTSNNLEEAVDQYSLKFQQAIMVSVISLLCLPFLVVMAFIKANHFSRPALILTNAVYAIEGKQDSSKFFEDVIDNGGRIGELARAMEKMACEIQQDENDLQDELESLKKKLYETRRRKLMPGAIKRSGESRDYEESI